MKTMTPPSLATPPASVASRLARWFIVAAVTILFANVFTVQAAADTRPANIVSDAALTAPVSISGRWLVDATGRVATFHGTNVVDKIPPYTPQHYGFGADDAAFLRQNSFNGIRLGITWAAVEPQPGVIDVGYLQHTRAFVEQMADRGVSTMVEFHQDKWGRSLSGEGAPAWATYTNGLPNPSQSLVASQVSPAIFAAFHNFFFNHPAPDGVGIADHFAQMWRRTAQALSGARGLLAYGILNEPGQGIPFDICVRGVYCPPNAASRLRSFLDKTGSAIRQVDPVTPMIESPYVLSAAGALSALSEPANRGVAFGFNSYAVPCILGAPVPVQVCQGSYEGTHREARNYMTDNNRPAILTEFGATNMADTLDSQTKLADQSLMSWFHWNYGGNDPSTTASSPTAEGLVKDARRPLTAANINHSNLYALSRVYPELVSGTPLTWSFDPATQRFGMRYDTERGDRSGRFAAGSLTRIAVPALRYPHGYRVKVTGGHVALQRPDTLIVASDANLVTVAVTAS